MASVSTTWGTEPQERQQQFPCDRLIPDASAHYYRGVSVNAPPTQLFRWLCQMRVAPYSYDWIDNFGRRSPQQLIPGLEQLAPGQSFMRIFDLAEFERNVHVTLRIKRNDRAFGLFGDLGVTYQIVPRCEMG